MKLSSMKLAPKEAKAELEPMKPEGPRYPYGTCLYLDKVAMEKLGLADAPKTGTEFNIVARGVVTGTSSRQSQTGEDYASVDIQLTDMGLEEQASAKSLATKMYGDGAKT